MVATVLHHEQAVGDFVNQGQMQNRAADEPGKRNEKVHWFVQNLKVLAVVEHFVESHQDQHDLEQKGQNDMHCDVHALLLFDLENPLSQM